MYLYGRNHLFANLKSKLLKLNFGQASEEQLDELLNDLARDDLLKSCNEGVLRSAHARKSYFKSNYHYVEPEPVYLGKDKTKTERFYQYVPVKETLEALFKQKCIREQHALSENVQGVPSVYADVKDGSLFSQKLLLQDPSVLSIILYQDSFEVVNPLGSGGKNHKVLAAYMTLGNILPHNRSNIDHMQLVLLCREEDFKFFGTKSIFNRLVEDLKELESQGLKI